MVHDPLFSITLLIDSYLEASLVAHLCFCEVAFLMDTFRASQPTCGWDISFRVSIFFHWDRSGVLKMVLSIVSSILVDTVSPSAMLIFPSGLVGIFVKIHQFLPWMLWGLAWLVSEYWSNIHFLFASVSYSTLSIYHLYSYPVLLAWCPFMWYQNQVMGDSRIL